MSYINRTVSAGQWNKTSKMGLRLDLGSSRNLDVDDNFLLRAHSNTIVHLLHYGRNRTAKVS